MTTAPKVRKKRTFKVWVGVDSLGEIHLDTIAGVKEACDNSHSRCEGDIHLLTTLAALTLTGKGKGKEGR